MSAVIFVGLGVMWVIVLVPMWLRRHDEVEEVRSVDKFNSAMHTLRRDSGSSKSYAAAPHRSRSVEVHVSGASAERKRKLSATERRAARPVVSAETRRRRTLVGLLLTSVFTLLLAVVVGGMLLWALQIIADVSFAAFVVHLRNRAQRAHRASRPASRPSAAQRRASAPRRAASSRPARVARPAAITAESAERSETRRIRWDDAPAVAASQLEPLFDQAAAFDQLPSFVETAEADRAAVFDQSAEFGPPARVEQRAEVYEATETYESAELYETTELDRIVAYDAPATEAERPAARYRFDDVAFDDTSFDRRVVDPIDVDEVAEPSAAELDVEPAEERVEVAPRPPRRVARTMRSRTRQTERTERVAAYDPVSESDGDGGIGERPWEPVPVPRPVYATKPKAPKRRNRAPEMEPVLPPVETAAELDPIDDLEEILDRRWAVND